MQQTIKLGNLTLPRTAGLAPMAGVADRAYRILCKEHQAALLVSEMISAKRALLRRPENCSVLHNYRCRTPDGLAAVRQRTGFHGKSSSNCPALSAGLD